MQSFSQGLLYSSPFIIIIIIIIIIILFLILLHCCPSLLANPIVTSFLAAFQAVDGAFVLVKPAEQLRYISSALSFFLFFFFFYFIRRVLHDLI